MLNRLFTVVAVMLALCLGTAEGFAQPPTKKKPKPGAATKADAGAKTDAAEDKSEPAETDGDKPAKTAKGKYEVATLGSGCFWCGEAVFEQLKGVVTVVSGYSGGTVVDPTYEQVSTGETGHAEVIEITFDPKVISFEELLEVFWKSHDPTTLNEQGPDHGTQYRSAIFYHSDEQRDIAEKSKQKHMKPGRNSPKIVTEITKFTVFYPAEEYHQDFFKNNPRHGYCQRFVRQKVAKVKKDFKDQLKEPAAAESKK